jgi:mannitol/fructose-specific phosphotransferase system IIA component (Ntr-type)
MQDGIALPHAKTDGVRDICVAVGIKKQGVNFDSIDGKPARLFIMILSPKKTAGPHLQFLAAIGAVLNSEEIREKAIASETVRQLLSLLRKGKV